MKWCLIYCDILYKWILPAVIDICLFFQHLAIKCSYQDRSATIGDILSVYSGNHGRAMVFCQTKRDADELATSSDLKQETHVMHGDIPQEKREIVLQVQWSPSNKDIPSAKQFCPYLRGVLGEREYYIHSWYLLPRICPF